MLYVQCITDRTSRHHPYITCMPYCIRSSSCLWVVYLSEDCAGIGSFIKCMAIYNFILVKTRNKKRLFFVYCRHVHVSIYTHVQSSFIVQPLSIRLDFLVANWLSKAELGRHLHLSDIYMCTLSFVQNVSFQRM